MRISEISIPFIAGQWSLPPSPPEGGGRAVYDFNPLHCGAVVASKEENKQNMGSFVFQSPSLRGSGRFAPVPPRLPAPPLHFNPLHCGAVVASSQPRRRSSSPLRISIPFIAGQWSLRDGGAPRRSRRLERFNPLHCGAVVASSDADVALVFGERSVSIPFIAGQWSLLLNPFCVWHYT